MKIRFKELPEKESGKIIQEFVNNLIMDFRILIDKDEAGYLVIRTIEWLGKSNEVTSVLPKVRKEMLENFRRYTPLCYASIRTAYKKVKEDMQL